MNIVLAQLKKDIQCQRRPLILWGICLETALIPLLFLNVFTHFAAPDLANTKVMLGILSVGGLALACVFAAGFGLFLLVPVLVVRIVHEDVLMGTTAFWLTRPIPREKLLAAKTLLIAALPLPLVLLGGTDARFGAGQFWAVEFAWIAAFAAIASITSGLRDFLTYGLVLFFGKSVFAAILERLWSQYHGPSSFFFAGVARQLSVVLQALDLNAPDFFHLCYFVGFSVAFIHQYLTLRTRRSLAILITTIVVVSLLQMVFGPGGDTPTVP